VYTINFTSALSSSFPVIIIFMTERERVGKGDEGGGKMEGEGERER